MKLLFTGSLLCVLLATCLDAQIQPPRAGFVRYGGLPVQGLYGIPGNFIPAGSAFGMVGAVSFSDADGLVFAGGRVVLARLDGSIIAAFDYQGPPPLLNSVDAKNAVAWLPGTHSLLVWDGKQFSALAFDDSVLDGSICSVSLGSTKVARFLVTHPDGTVSGATVSLTSGNVISSDLLPGVHGPAFQFGALAIWRDDRGLEIQSANGSLETLAAPVGLFTAEQMSSQWVHLYFSSNGTHWALHLGAGGASLTRLPLPLVAKENGR